MIGYWVIKAEWNTRYANPLVKSSFALIKTNTSLEEVYSLAGRPLFADVNLNRSDGGYSVKRDQNVDAEHLLNLMTDPKVDIQLMYSAAKPSANDYYLYCVFMRENRAFRVVIREPQD